MPRGRMRTADRQALLQRPAGLVDCPLPYPVSQAEQLALDVPGTAHGRLIS